MRIYLAGPILGQTDAACRGWREQAKEMLVPHTCVDPMRRDYRGKERDPGIERQIVELDKRDIDSCDIVLVHYSGPSAGTCMEILYAWERKKIVVVADVGSAVLSPWVVYHSNAVLKSIGAAADWIRWGLT